ncbi:MAG: GNAT family N-acetyltransferase [Candidatus Bathyarchaeia archaeon]
MSIQIVDAVETDVEELVTIYSSADLYHNREEASWFVKSYFDYHHVKVAKCQNRVIGVLFWNVIEEKHHGLAEIRDFWIDENFRRRGISENLLRTVVKDMEEFFRKEGHTLRKILVTTGEDNEPARKLYEKVGFERIAVLPDLFAEGENELVYVLTITR